MGHEEHSAFVGRPQESSLRNENGAMPCRSLDAREPTWINIIVDMPGGGTDRLGLVVTQIARYSTG
jgi:hypothetical protein